MMYFQTNDPWAAVAVAAEHNNGKTYNDGVTVREVDITQHGGFYFVPMQVPVLGVETVTYEQMTAYFEPIEGI